MSREIVRMLEKPRKKRKSIEAQHQRAFFRWVSYHREFRDYIFHIPNGGSRRDAIEGKNLKLLGVKAGIWDILGAKPSKGYHGFWCEMKSTKGKLTEEQELFGILMENAGYKTVIARSFEEARDAWIDYIS
jgi:hypothetical protein